MLKQPCLAELKTDIFLGANVMDALLTYFALQSGTCMMEFNSIIRTVMDTIGIGAALFLKVALCVGTLWILRKTRRENLLIPLSAILVLVALGNLLVMRLHGIEI